jgi:hypothetical protein
MPWKTWRDPEPLCYQRLSRSQSWALEIYSNGAALPNKLADRVPVCSRWNQLFIGAAAAQLLRAPSLSLNCSGATPRIGHSLRDEIDQQEGRAWDFAAIPRQYVDRRVYGQNLPLAQTT